MSEDGKSLAARIERATANTPADHIVNVLKAGLATTPFCGGIASLMNDYIPSGRLRRLEEFASQIAADLTELSSRVDEGRLLTDEFAFVFEKCLRGVAENYQQEKLEAFRGILVNAAIGIDMPEQEKEYFLNLVNTFSILHIRILRFMADPIAYLDASEISRDQIRGGFSTFFPVAIPGVDIEVIKSAFEELYQYGLISTDKTIFATMTSAQGLDLLGGRVTDFGHRFIAFCTKPNE